MTTIPNPSQLRAMARPDADPLPCVPGRHCERRASDLGACIAGECNPPRAAVPDGVRAEEIQMTEAQRKSLSVTRDVSIPGVSGLVEGEAVSLEEAHLVGYWKGYDDAKKGLAGLSEENERKAAAYDALIADGVRVPAEGRTE